jgi:hypothetical protein
MDGGGGGPSAVEIPPFFVHNTVGADDVEIGTEEDTDDGDADANC